MKLLIIFVSIVVGVVADISQDIDWLHKRLNSNFWNNSVSYRPGRWEKQRGLYKSQVHMNSLDRRNSDFSTWMRNHFQIDDINMFVTSFVLYGLLEADELGTLKLDHHQFSLSLEALSMFRDKNVEYGIPQYVFWPQQNRNGTWSAAPANLVKFITTFPQAPIYLYPVLKPLGLSILVYFKMFAQVFIIPADNDDSSVNLVLHAMLKETNSQHFKFWDSINFNIEGYYKQALKYAYRPFDSNYSQNPEADEIDPRTYHNLWDFIATKKQQAIQQNEKPSLILPTTWLLNKREQVKDALLMPLNTNNVDVTVCANFLFGLSYQVLNKRIKMDQELTQMVENTVQLLVYSVKQLVEKRPDLVLVYYPSKYDFYWFIARTVHLYKRRIQELEHPFTEVYATLNILMKGVGTEHILKKKICKEDQCYWNEFLGNYAKKTRNQDAIFSTALALNALLDTWTTRRGKVVTYDQDIPSQVGQTIRKGINYIRKSLSPHMKEMNAFFSGSFKQSSTSPWLYPANIHKDIKGKDIDPQNASTRDIQYGADYLMKGAIDRKQYQEWLKLKWFGQKVPEQDPGLNSGSGITFPYWASEAITEIMCITSLSKFMRAQEKHTYQPTV